MCINIYLSSPISLSRSVCAPSSFSCFSRTPPCTFIVIRVRWEELIGLEVFCVGAHINVISPSSGGQLLAAVVFSLITSCQYANKWPPDWLPPPRRAAGKFDGSDENIADAARIAISRCNMMCEFQQAPSILSILSSLPPSLLLLASIPPFVLRGGGGWGVGGAC